MVEMARSRRHLQACYLEENAYDSTTHIRSPSNHDKKLRANLCAVMLIVIGVFLILPFIVSRSFSFASLASSAVRHQLMRHVDSQEHLEEGFNSLKDDPSLGGLISEEADRMNCRSRGVIHNFRPVSKYKPSSHLVAKLRNYEALHKKCAPGSKYFNRSINILDSGQLGGETECRYVIWVAYSGLGNRLVSIASSFVYALLTNRVLLLDGRSDLGDLFCEPFPGTSWILPADFPLLKSHTFNETSPHRFGHLLEKGAFKSWHSSEKGPTFKSGSLGVGSLPVLAYMHVTHTYNFHDKQIFCPKEQDILNQIPWLILKSNQYFVPSLYLYLLHFREELNQLFPVREAVFHHIGRYLFYPTNSVWGWITRFHQAYLSKATERVGIQIRTFESNLKNISGQAMTCAFENKLLPDVIDTEEGVATLFPDLETDAKKRSLVVLVTSLQQDYFEQIRDLYLEHPTETGDLVSVYQPSHELVQQTHNIGHNRKAWAEICLLSFSDKLITSAWSTFGYAAQGLAGITPWILNRVEADTIPTPACSLAMSIEPCFHAPPYQSCETGNGTDTSKILPYVKHCEDITWGLKLMKDAEL